MKNLNSWLELFQYWVQSGKVIYGNKRIVDIENPTLRVPNVTEHYFYNHYYLYEVVGSNRKIEASNLELLFGPSNFFQVMCGDYDVKVWKMPRIKPMSIPKYQTSVDMAITTRYIKTIKIHEHRKQECVIQKDMLSYLINNI